MNNISVWASMNAWLSWNLSAITALNQHIWPTTTREVRDLFGENVLGFLVSVYEFSAVLFKKFGKTAIPKRYRWQEYILVWKSAGFRKINEAMTLGNFFGDCLLSKVCGPQDLASPNFYFGHYLNGVVCSNNLHTVGLWASWSLRWTTIHMPCSLIKHSKKCVFAFRNEEDNLNNCSKLHYTLLHICWNLPYNTCYINKTIQNRILLLTTAIKYGSITVR